jgi:hypothetical protein
MKKLLILAAAVMTVAVTHAAAVGWTLAGATAYVGGKYDIFVVGMNGVTDAAQIAALVAADKSVSDYAFYEGGTVAANGSANLSVTASGKSITYSGSGTDTYQAFAVLWKSDGKEASYTSIASIQMANDSQSKTFGFMNQSSNLAANNFSVAPEPTSGLLLLLGVAGLALKRKRA